MANSGVKARVRRMGVHGRACGGEVWLHVLFNDQGVLTCESCRMHGYQVPFEVILDQDVIDEFMRLQHGLTAEPHERKGRLLC